ncbi:MAG: peptidyl-prolyl cis-trans isomerase [Planctomycetaceae bacterium]
MIAISHRLMHAAIALLALAVSGCEYFRTVRANSPVIAENPPRMAAPLDHRESPRESVVDRAAPADADSPSADRSSRFERGSDEIVLASAERFSERLDDSDVVALVNGEAILAGDVLRRYADPLRQAERQASPADLERMKRELIQRDLPDRIDRALLLQSLKRNIPEPQLAALKQHIDELFEEEVAKMMVEMKVHSKAELEEQLQKRGATLAEMRAEFDGQRRSLEYLQAQAFKEIEIGRRDLIAHYEEHAADYDVPGRARWQQIQLGFRRFRDKQQARELMDRIAAEHAAGADFDDLARHYSDGPNRDRGGRWEWTTQGSLADRDVDRWLFEGPVGEPGPIFESPDAVKLVRVVEREPAHRIPFEQVQGEIKETLTGEARQQAAREVLEKLRRDASIVTMFDAPDRQAPRTGMR